MVQQTVQGTLHSTPSRSLVMLLSLRHPILLLAFATPAFSSAATVPGDYATIQAALDAVAAGTLDAHEVIRVSEGVYSEALTFTDAAHGFHLASATGPDSTVIDASGRQAPVLLLRNVKGVIDIDGFTLTGGNSPRGGGISAKDAELHLRNCIIEHNRTAEGGAGLRFFTTDATIEDCIVRFNSAAKWGGGLLAVAQSHIAIRGVHLHDNSAGLESPVGTGGGLQLNKGVLNMADAVIASNRSMFAGGGIFVIGTYDSDQDAAHVKIKDSIIANNRTDSADDHPLSEGGGIHIEGNTTATIEGTVITRNTADQGAGANSFRAHYQITNTVISDNVSTEGTGGGLHAISLAPHASTVTISESIIRRNSSPNAAGISVAGHDCATTGTCADLLLENTAILDNRSQRFGGGLTISNATATIRDANILQNTTSSTATGGMGGGIRVIASDLFAESSGVSANHAGQVGGGLYADVGATVEITDSIVSGNTTPDSDQAGGLHVGSIEQPAGFVHDAAIVNNSGFQIREQACPHGIPAPIFSYHENNIFATAPAGIYKAACSPPGSIRSIDVFNALSPGKKTRGNDSVPSQRSHLLGVETPWGSTNISWSTGDYQALNIEGLENRQGSAGSVDVMPVCTTEYTLGDSSLHIEGSGLETIYVQNETISGGEIIEALRTVLLDSTVLESNGDLVVRAGSRIEIRPPFHSEAGARFSARIVNFGCSP